MSPGAPPKLTSCSTQLRRPHAHTDSDVLPVRLLTWNVNGRRRQLREQVDAICGRSPDIVALQEVTAGTVGQLRSTLPEHGLANVIDSFADSPSLTAIGPRRYGVLLASRFPLVDSVSASTVPWPE